MKRSLSRMYKSREIRKAEERAEIERKKEEESRILNEIFEREYNPPSSRNVHYSYTLERPTQEKHIMHFKG